MDRLDLKDASVLLGLLSEVFLDPEADPVGRLQNLAEETGDPILREGAAGLREALAEPREVAVAFVRLFLHADRGETVHPYESVHRSGRLMDPECLKELRLLYDAADIRPREDLQVPPDHLGLELEFLAFLLEQAAAAPEGSAARLAWSALASRMVEEHLVPFADSFLPRLNAADPHPFYRWAGRLLDHGLEAARRALSADAASAGGSAGRS